MARYIELLNLLLSYGDKLPVVMQSIQRIVAEVQFILDTLGIQQLMQAEAVSPEVAELETQVSEAAQSGPEATFAGPLQNIFDFIRNNPKLVEYLLEMFLKRS